MERHIIGIKANKIDAMQAVSRHECSGMRVHERLGPLKKFFKVMWWREQAMERDDSQDGSAAKYHWFYESGLEKKCFLSETKGINLPGFFLSLLLFCH